MTGNNETDTAWKTILQGVQYNDTSNAPSNPNFVTVTATNAGRTPGVDTQNISVTAVNDAPTLTATASSPSFTEAAGPGTQAAAVNVFSGASAGTVESGQSITALTFTVGGLQNGASEKIVVDGTSITLGENSSGTTTTNTMGYAVTISGGTATVALTKGDGTSVSNINTLINGITYQNTNTDNPTASARTFTLTQIKDNGGTTNSGVDTTSLSIGSTVTVVPVNDTPTSTNDSVTTNEDTAVVLSLSDFGTFADVDGSSIAAVKITALESAGSLEYNNGSWVAVTVDQEISAADITDGKLRFTPDANANANPYATIDFKVGDGIAFSASAYTLTVNVNPVNDVPAVALVNTTTDLNENTDASVRIKMADISITDDAQGINNITLSGDDAASFEVDGTVLYLKAGTTLNYEAQSSYAVTVNVDDSTVGSTPDASQSFTLNVTNLDEVAPTITSGATADAITENSGAGQVVYTATSADTGDIASGSTTYSLKSGDDAAAFSIDGATGAVTLTGDPDYEGKSSYSFTVIATDAAGHASEQAVSLAIDNLDEVPVNHTPILIARILHELHTLSLAS